MVILQEEKTLSNSHSKNIIFIQFFTLFLCTQFISSLLSDSYIHFPLFCPLLFISYVHFPCFCPLLFDSYVHFPPFCPLLSVSYVHFPPFCPLLFNSYVHFPQFRPLLSDSYVLPPWFCTGHRFLRTPKNQPDFVFLEIRLVLLIKIFLIAFTQCLQQHVIELGRF